MSVRELKEQYQANKVTELVVVVVGTTTGRWNEKRENYLALKVDPRRQAVSPERPTAAAAAAKGTDAGRSDCRRDRP